MSRLNVGLGFVSLFGGIGYSLIGEWTMLLTLLVVLVVSDFASGLVTAALANSFSWKVLLRGFAKKVLIFAFIAIAHLLDTILGQEQVVRDVTILFYLLHEFVSLTDHAGRIGLPVPSIIKEAITNLRTKTGGRK